MRALLTPTFMLYATVVGCSSTPSAAEPQAEPLLVSVVVPPPTSVMPVPRPRPTRDDEPPPPATTSAPEVDPPESDARLRAKEIFRAGVEAYGDGDYAEASRLFQESYDLSDEPLLLYNIARAELKAGRTTKACDALRTLIRRSPGSASGVDSAKDLMRIHCRP